MKCYTSTIKELLEAFEPASSASVNTYILVPDEKDFAAPEIIWGYDFEHAFVDRLREAYYNKETLAFNVVWDDPENVDDMVLTNNQLDMNKIIKLVKSLYSTVYVFEGIKINDRFPKVLRKGEIVKAISSWQLDGAV